MQTYLIDKMLRKKVIAELSIFRDLAIFWGKKEVYLE
jgi:hypothetical protein